MHDGRRQARQAMDLLETALATTSLPDQQAELIAGALLPTATRLLALDMLSLDPAAGEAFEGGVGPLF